MALPSITSLVWAEYNISEGDTALFVSKFNAYLTSLETLVSEENILATALEDWAVRAEDSAIPTVSGGDASTTFSAYHHAQKAAASAILAASFADFPTQAGNSNKILQTDGSVISWEDRFGGAYSASVSVDTAISLSNGVFQDFTTTVDDLIFTLPTPGAGIEGGPLVVIKNNNSSASSIAIKLGTNNFIEIPINGIREFYFDGANWDYNLSEPGRNGIANFEISDFIDTGIVGGISMVEIDATTVFIAYYDGANTIRCYIGTLTGDSLALGTLHTPTTTMVANSPVRVDKLTSTKYVISYESTTGDIGTIIVENSGGTLSSGTEVVQAANYDAASGADFMSIVAMNSTQFIVAFQQGTTSFDGVCHLYSVSGTGITYENAATFHNGTSGTTEPDSIDIVRLSDTHFGIVFGFDSSSTAAKVRVGEITITPTLSLGSAVDISTEQINRLSAHQISSTELVVFYNKYLSYGLYAVRVTVSGTTATVETPAKISSDLLAQESLNGPRTSLKIDNSNFILFFQAELAGEAVATNANYLLWVSKSGTTFNADSKETIVSDEDSYRHQVVPFDSSNAVMLYTDANAGNDLYSKIIRLSF